MSGTQGCRSCAGHPIAAHLLLDLLRWMEPVSSESHLQTQRSSTWCVLSG